MTYKLYENKSYPPCECLTFLWAII